MAGWVAAGITLGSEALKLVDTTNDKDPERFARAETWYNAAVQGDATALCFLKYMGGKRGCAPGGCAGTAACGFATQVAKDYCEQLYQDALLVLSGQKSMASPIPSAPAPSGTTATQVGGYLKTTSEITGAAATKLGTPPQPNPEAVLSYVTQAAPWILVLGGGAVIVWLILRARR